MIQGFYPNIEPRRTQPPSTPTRQGGTQRSQATYDFTPKRAFPSVPFRADSDWHPNASPIDGHDEPFEDIGEGLAPVEEPPADNVRGGAVGEVDSVELTDGTSSPVAFTNYTSEDFGSIPPNIQA